MKTNRYEKEYFSKIVSESGNLSDVARNLGLKPYYGNRQTIKKYIKTYNLDITHFKFHSNGGNFTKIKTKEILVENSTYTYTTNLKDRLYKEGLKERKCELCNQGEEWNDVKISLILDHKNGVNNDNRIENLRIVCPNCNAGLETHGGKNIGNSKYNYVTEKKKYYCECGNEITKSAIKCRECVSKSQRKIERPTYKELIKEIVELGYCGVGRKYGVSDNAIRKWKKQYEKI